MECLNGEQKETNWRVEKLLKLFKKEEPAKHVQGYTSSQMSSSAFDYGEEWEGQEEGPQASPKAVKEVIVGVTTA